MKSLDELTVEGAYVGAGHQAQSPKALLQEKARDRRRANTPQGSFSEIVGNPKCRVF